MRNLQAGALRVRANDVAAYGYIMVSENLTTPEMLRCSKFITLCN